MKTFLSDSVGRAEDSAFPVSWLVAEKRAASSLLLDRLAVVHEKEKLFWSCVFLGTGLFGSS